MLNTVLLEVIKCADQQIKCLVSRNTKCPCKVTTSENLNFSVDVKGNVFDYESVKYWLHLFAKKFKLFMKIVQSTQYKKSIK